MGSDPESPPPAPAPPDYLVVRNETASRLRISASAEVGRTGVPELVIAPFETLSIEHDQEIRWRDQLLALKGRRYVELLRPRLPEPAHSSLTSSYVAFVFLAGVALAIVGAFLRDSTAWVAIGVTFGVLVVLVAAALLIPAIRTGVRSAWTWFWGRDVLNVGTTFLISGAVPAVGLFFAADLGAQIDGLGQGTGEASEFTLVGRAVQWAFIWAAAFLPAGLFFLFDRVKSATVRETFERDILRFDPTLTTLSDVHARYGALIGQTFPAESPRSRDGWMLGPAGDLGGVAALSTADSSMRRRGRSGTVDRKLPVVLATFIFSLMWTIAILNPDLAYDAGDDRDNFVLSLLEPHASPIVFAFLGSYVFTLMGLLRSYVRSDLRPKSFTHAAVRVVIAVISAWLLQVMFVDAAPNAPTTESSALLVVAFVIGFFPETLFVRLQEVARSFAPSGRFRFAERFPLTELVGIDIYDRARLMDEGVGNIEGLAHHNLPELMVQTRIPVGRIVHWADQAILYLHVVAPFDDKQEQVDGPAAVTLTEILVAASGPAASTANGADGAKTTRATQSSPGERRLRTLQSYGIQTATDLLRVARTRRADRDDFLSLLDEPDAGRSRNRPRRLELIMAAVRDEQWMQHLECWHSPRHAETQTIRVDPRGRISEPSSQRTPDASAPTPAQRVRTGSRKPSK